MYAPPVTILVTEPQANFASGVIGTPAAVDVLPAATLTRTPSGPCNAMAKAHPVNPDHERISYIIGIY